MEGDKVPFIVTIAVAILGWTATYVVTRITSAPTLEYEVSDPVPLSSRTDGKSMEVRLTNLTRSVTLKNLTVLLIAPKGSQLVGDATEMRPVPPAFEGNEPWKQRGGQLQYTIPKVHPGWTFRIHAGFVGEKPPVVRFESEDPIFATPPTWETFFARHELWFLLGIAAIWIGGLLLYFVCNIRRRKA